MVRRRHLAAIVASATVLAGCALVTGVGDLRVDPLASDGGVSPSAVDADADADAPRAADATGDAFDGARSTDDGAITDATTDGGDAGDARLREVTFEDGTLLGIHGGDSVFGSPFLVSGLSALSGNESMRVENGVGGVQVDFAAQRELYATMLVRFQNPDVNPSTLFTVVPPPGGALVELTFPNGRNGPFALAIAGSLVASGISVDQTQVYRFGFHVRDDAAAGFVQIFVSVKGAAFGPPVISMATSKLGPSIAVRMGNFDMNSSNSKIVFDDLFLDSASLPLLP